MKKALAAAKYRMSFDAFNTLLELLRIMITPNLFKASNLCDEPIYPEMVMAIGLRWLGGRITPPCPN
jgi:hypothetical protein